MTRIRPIRLRRVAQAAPTAESRALIVWVRAVAASLLCASGCSLDTAATSLARDDGGPKAVWMPRSEGRNNGIISQQTRDGGSDNQADAQASTDDITVGDAGMINRDADAGRRVVDAGQPPKPTSDGSAGSASSMAPMESKDAAAPMVTMPPCQPGIYEGAFEGPVTFAVGSINSVSGTIRAELVLEASAEYLLVNDGLMTGRDSVGVAMTAAWSGRLNCATKQLENARHETGAWENGSSFTGTLEGSYSTNPYSLSGTWQVQSEQIPLAGGNGTWRMTLQGNTQP